MARLVRVLSVLLALVVGAALLPGLSVTSAVAGAKGKRPQVELPEPVSAVAAPAAAVPKMSKADVEAEATARREWNREVKWPGRGSAVLDPGAGEESVQIGPVTAELEGAQAATIVEVLGQNRTRADGVDGVAMRLSTDMTSAADSAATDTDVRLAVDVSQFAHAYGANWGSRLQFHAYPNCDDLAQLAGCGEPVALDADTAGEELVTTVPAELRTSSVMVVLAAAGASADGHGDFSATPMAPSSQWSAGGSSGDFSWTYPMRVPPANGGPQPELAITYSAQSIDGRTSSTNNQGSLVGDGFGFTESYVARQYIPCAYDGNTTKGDLCWKKDNATLVLNGQAQELFQASDGTWRFRADDGSRIRHLTGGPGNNPDNNKEYWELATADGTKYYFGRSTVPGSTADTNSVWWVPVSGNDAGEPCYTATFASSFCNQAWQWNLDYVVDVHGNTMSYWYTAETNRYAKNLTASPGAEYVRGGRLMRIDYGSHTSAPSAAAPMRVELGYATRCLAASGCDSYSKAGWPDTPYDQICAAGAACTGKFSPTFFNRHRLTSIKSSIRRDGTYQGVDRWNLEHSFRTAGGSHPTVLWPNSIQHSGLVGTSITLPKVTLGSVNLPNRPSVPSDGLSEISRYRLRTITSETGAHTTVNYVTDECVTNRPQPAANTKRCFPQRWTPPGETVPRTDWFLKYVVNDVTTSDLTGGSPDLTTYYQYADAAWAYDDDPYTKAGLRTWSDWRGYRTVTTIVGNEAYAGPRSKQVATYFQGMDGDRNQSGGQRQVSVADSTGTSHTDAHYLAGKALEASVYNGTAGARHSSTINTPWAYKTAGSGLDSSWLVRTGKSETREAIAGGGTRTTRVVTEHNNLGQPIRANDHGDLAVTNDQTCTAVAYADETTTNGTWFVGFPSRSITSKGLCTANALDPAPADLLEATRTRYDGLSIGDTPTRGLATHAQRATAATGTGIDYQTTQTVAYDNHGRPVSTIVPTAAGTNRTDTVAYTTSSDGTVVGTVSTLDVGGKAHTTTTTVEPAWGTITKTVDPNNRAESSAHDGLGRTVSYWAQNRSPSATPTRTFTYKVSNTSPSAVTTKRLHDSGASYITESVELLDSLLRTRQTQVPAPGSGRVLSGTSYDGRGAISSTYDGVHVNGAPSDTFFALTPGQMASQIRYTYDGLGRVTDESLYSNNTFEWKTATSYPGADRTKVTPPDGAAPRTQYTDARGQVVKTIEHGTSDIETTRSYDLVGQLTQMTSPAGTWTWEYDLRGRNTASHDPDSGTTTTQYTANDLPTVVTDARGTSTRTVYDNLNRTTHRYSAATATPSALSAEWTYDTIAKGHPTASIRYLDGADGTKITSSVSSYSTWYAVARHQFKIEAAGTSADLVEGFPTTLTWSNSYKVDHNLGSRSLPRIAQGSTTVLSAEGLTYRYNELGMFKSLQGRTAIVQDTVYNPVGTVAQAVLGQGSARQIYVANSYDAATQRQTRQLTTTNVDAVVRSDIKYSYDDAGNPTKIADTARGDTQCFDYDDHQRLTDAWTPSTGDCGTQPSNPAGLGGPAPYQQSWAYDTAGHRTTQTSTTNGQSTTTSYAYGGSGQPRNAVTTATRPTPLAPQIYDYDEAGNTTSRPNPDGTGNQTLQWDAEGKLTQLDTGTDTTRYVYDPDGTLLIESDGEASTLFLGETELRWDKTTQQLSAKRHYATPVNATATRSNDTTIDFLITDHHNTATLSLNGLTLTATDRWTNPFGEQRGSTAAAWPNTRQFLNKHHNPTTGLTAVGARQYDPTLGKFISADPILDLDTPQQLLGYNYANDNPLTFSDPTGKLPIVKAVVGLVYFALAVVDAYSAGVGNTGGQTSGASHTQSTVQPSGSSPPVQSPSGETPHVQRTKGKICVWAGQTCLAYPIPIYRWLSGHKVPAQQDPPSKEDFLAGSLNNLRKAAVGDSLSEALLNGLLTVVPGGRGGKQLAAPPTRWVKNIFKRKPKPSAAKTRRVDDVDNLPCNCFVAGTKVQAADGEKSIEDVKVGDKVWARNLGTGKNELRRVTGLFKKHASRVTTMTVAGGSKVTVTEEHPFYVEGIGWVMSGDLVVGDRLAQRDGGSTAITAIEVQRVDTIVYNFEVAGDHNYYVTDAQLLVHNCPAGHGPPARLTNPQATDLANRLGYTKTNYRSSGQPVFRSGKTYITQDIDGHIGGTWKMARTPDGFSKQDRLGTYDYDLNRIGP